MWHMPTFGGGMACGCLTCSIVVFIINIGLPIGECNGELHLTMLAHFLSLPAKLLSYIFRRLTQRTAVF